MNYSDSPKLKILHIISGDLWAGAETMAFNLLNQLSCYKNVEISAILLNEGRLADELRRRGIDTHVIDEKNISFTKIAKKIRGIVSNDPPHVIHSHRYKENLLAFLACRFRKGIRLVSTQHGLPEVYAKQPRFVQKSICHANFFLISKLFTTVAVSEDISKALVNCYGFRRDRIEVIHNGIELPQSPGPKENTGSFVIGSSGRLFPVKDYSLMVDIANAVVSENHEDFRFELAGEGPERPSLEDKSVRYGVKDHFNFKGHIDDMDSFYDGLDAYINTSIHEGIPMTILEAMGHGLPIIAPAVGGIVEIIEDGKEGFLIKSRNPRDFAEKCLLLKKDLALREKMSRDAREKAEKFFTAEIMAKKYCQLYLRKC